MKMQPTLVAAVIAVFAGVSYAALGADDKAPAAQTDAAQTASKKGGHVAEDYHSEKEGNPPQPRAREARGSIPRHDGEGRR